MWSAIILKGLEADTLKSKTQTALIISIPFLVFVLHVMVFGNYIIDDAGILFSYSRNIAEGYGIVAQPGLAPVEGCSDFLWMMLFVPFFWLKISDPVITVKIFSACLILILYLFISIRLKNVLPGFLIILFLLLLSITTPFVIWNSSGLENPLYILLISFLFYCSWQTLHLPNKKLFLQSAIIAFLIAITRPDGILYFFALPFLMIVHSLLTGKLKQLPWRFILLYGSTFALASGLFLTFRYFYFGELVPNTYYFKGGPKLNDVFDIILLKQSVLLKLETLFGSVMEKVSFLSIIILLAINCRIYFFKLYNEFHLTITVFFIFAILNFLLLPGDWMAEFRFATPFLFFFYLMLMSSIYSSFTNSKIQSLVTAFLLIMLLCPLLFTFYNRSKKFSSFPTVPFQVVTQRSLKFDRYAEKLGLQNASILTPDCGGTLYYSKLRIYDMAGLIDKRYALTTMGKDKEAFYKLVLEIDKPTFIALHADWAFHTELNETPKFKQDYVPIDEHEYNLYGKNIKDGNYVRRDVINNNIDLLKNL